MKEKIVTDRKNVIILWNYLNWGGAQIYFLSIVKHAPKDWKFTIVIPRKSSSEIAGLFADQGAEIVFQDVVLDNDAAETVRAKLKRQWRRIHSEIETYRFIRRKNLHNTVLHIETAPWQSWILIKKLADLTDVFVTMHNSLPEFSKFREFVWKRRLRYVAKLKSFHIFASNNDTKKSLKNSVNENFWNRIEVTYTSVDPAEIEAALMSDDAKEIIRERFSIKPEKFVILCVGQFIERKGRSVFLESAKKIIVRNKKDFQFLWLTQTDLTAEDADLIESYKLGDSFKIIKSVDVGKERSEILSFFRIADVFALASYVEGLPIALLEAMALGIPSISTDVNAIPEALKNEETGLLIEAGNSSELVRAIEKLKSDPVLRAKISVQGRRFVLENFDERVCAGKVLETYENALRSKM